jgi:hypothetical protein
MVRDGVRGKRGEERVDLDKGNSGRIRRLEKREFRERKD